jgi:RNA polymerase sigma-70 factor, ECF subfamily
MSDGASNQGPPFRPAESAALLRQAIAASHETLLRSVALFIVRTERGLSWPAAAEKASEILNEAVEQALKHAGKFDPTRSATAWVRGIAARLLLARNRKAARESNCIAASTLGDEAWKAALNALITQPGDAAAAARLDLEQIVARLPKDERRAIEQRYFEGLDGTELANALGVPTAGAARVRVCRALQSLRILFARAEEEAHP